MITYFITAKDPNNFVYHRFDFKAHRLEIGDIFDRKHRYKITSIVYQVDNYLDEVREAECEAEII